MIRTRLIAALAAVSALALPAVALAQTPGDDQYQDPLAHHHSTPHQSGSTGTSGTSGTTGTTTQQTATTGSAPQTQGSDPGGRQLPRTGFDVILPIELGLALLLAGLTMRRVLVVQSRRR